MGHVFAGVGPAAWRSRARERRPPAVRQSAASRYNVVRMDRDHHRFRLPGDFYFELAPWDWSIGANWCGDCGDDCGVYEELTGADVHVNYLGN